MYVTAWARRFRAQFNQEFNIFPGTGATTIPMLGSLFIGWGFKFIVLLDHDEQGENSRNKLIHDLSVPHSRIVQPQDAGAIEDLFSADNFQALLT